MKLFFTPDEELYNKRIDEIFDDEVLDSNFWLYWRTMFAFENWHSALEMKLYLKRYHPSYRRPARFYGAALHAATISMKSMILPMVQISGGARCAVPLQHRRWSMWSLTCRNGRKAGTPHRSAARGQGGCHRLDGERPGFHHQRRLRRELRRSAVRMSRRRSTRTIREGGGWDMWRKIAAQDPSFGHPDKFC